MMFRTFEQKICEAHNYLHGYVTTDFHPPPRRKVIWEVYGGDSRVSQVAQSLGAEVEIFGPSMGWNFDDPSHRKLLLERQARSFPMKSC